MLNTYTKLVLLLYVAPAVLYPILLLTFNNLVVAEDKFAFTRKQIVKVALTPLVNLIMIILILSLLFLDIVLAIVAKVFTKKKNNS